MAATKAAKPEAAKPKAARVKYAYTLEEVLAERPPNEANVARHMESMIAQVRAHELADLRRGLGLTQQQIAKAMKVSQSRISRIERGELDRSELGTLRAYVEALGGKLGVVATFGDRTIVLR